MKAIIRNTYYGLKSSFHLVQGNARVLVYVQPFWAIANAMYFPFLSLFMKAVGCSDFEIGVINAVGMVAGAVIGLFAGWLTDRMGRRLGMFFADTLCWTLPCLLWGVSRSFAWFLAGSVANAFVRMSSVGWNCSLTEDTPPEKRLTVFWWMNIVNNAAIFFTPLMSLLIRPLGMERAMRIVLLASGALYMALFLVRYRCLRETGIGLERMRTSKGASPLGVVPSYIPLVKMLLKSPVLLTFLLIRSLNFVQAGLKSTFLPITLVGIRFDSGVIGTINLVSGAIMLLVQLALLPRLRRLEPDKPLMASLLALLASNGLLCLTPPGNMPVLMFSTVVSAAGTIVSGMLVDTATANAMPDRERAPLLALISILIVALSAPFQVLGGALAEIPGVGPRLPMLIIAVIFAACAALLAASIRRERRAGHAESRTTAPG